MRPKYYIRVNKIGVETMSDKYDLVTTRKDEYTKFAKKAIKDGAESIDVYASVHNECDGDNYMSYITTFYAEEKREKKRIEDVKFYSFEAEVRCTDGSVCTFTWIPNYDVSEEEAAEWMTENNIHPDDIDFHAHRFEKYFNLENVDN